MKIFSGIRSGKFDFERIEDASPKSSSDSRVPQIIEPSLAEVSSKESYENGILELWILSGTDNLEKFFFFFPFLVEEVDEKSWRRTKKLNEFNNTVYYYKNIEIQKMEDIRSQNFCFNLV